MLRRDILEIVERLGRVGLREISMTTNGTRLQKLAYDLKDAGLNRVNISLHSLRPDRFSFITQTARLEDSLETIEVAIDAELTPVKLNVTLLKGVNDDEVEDFIQYSRSLGGGRTNVLQLIELVATEQAFYNRFHVDMLKVEDMIKSRVVRTSFRALHNRLRYHLKDGVIVEIVRPMHNSRFCMGNNRIRITHDGRFKPCLLREDNHIDFITAMRNGASDEELAQIFKQAVLVREPFFKPECFKPVSERQTIALATQDGSSR